MHGHFGHCVDVAKCLPYTNPNQNLDLTKVKEVVRFYGILSDILRCLKSPEYHCAAGLDGQVTSNTSHGQEFLFHF